jgi:hypothetical protein
MGVGGEWAVAAALVAEVFPSHARAHASGIFHASSVLGTWLATLAGLAVGTHWRLAYLVSITPALLVLWVRASVGESQSWRDAGTRAVHDPRPALGSLRALLGSRPWGVRAALGTGLAAVGLASFWSVTIAGQDLAERMLLHGGSDAARAKQQAKFAYGIVQTAGGGLGLLAFAPLAAHVGRRAAFAITHAAALVIVPATCYLPQTYGQLLALLPLFGFLTLGMHAGYAIYFPELFPTHLRATGTGFCFNVGRVIAAPMLFLSGAIKATPGVDLRVAICGLASFYVIGLLLVLFLPETKGQPLP